MGVNCHDCGGPVGQDKGPPDGWQLEDGRTVCHACCVADFCGLVDAALNSFSEQFCRDLLP